MRIAYITTDPGVPVFGRKGCSIHVQEVLRAMARQRGEIDLFASNCSGADSARKVPGVHLHPLPAAPRGDLAVREQQCLAANAGLCSALKNQGPFSLVYERYSLWSFAGMEYAQATGTPGILEVNAPLIEEQAEHRGLVDRAGAQTVAERVFGAASAIVVVSEEVACYLKDFPEAQGKVQVVPNGVSPERFPPGLQASRPGGDGVFTVGFVGSMKPWHGIEKLIDAFARFQAACPKSRLLLVGDGTVRERLESQVAARGLESVVQFTGAVEPSEVPALLASMDLAVAPYPQLTNFYFSPLKVYEYMAAGLPVIASRVGQIEKIIAHEETGFLVPPGDAVALAAGLERMQKDPGLRRRLGEAARIKVLRDHTWDGTVERILQLAGVAPAPVVAAE